MHRFRILVVDDFDAFRRFLRSMLEKKTECEVVGETSDGLEAVAKAEQLQPDLILLDLNLRTISGFEVARRIRKLLPNSRILFVTQNSTREIAQGALQMGANGYLLKFEAADLPVAIETVMRGEQYISRRLK
jgi:DNA-binding NarL/FixJ family response regulator